MAVIPLAASNLPSGLLLDNGMITGSLAQAGDYAVEITAENSFGTDTQIWHVRVIDDSGGIGYRHWKLEVSDARFGDIGIFELKLLKAGADLPMTALNATASSVTAELHPGYALDGNTSTRWNSGSNPRPHWIQWETAEPADITGYRWVATQVFYDYRLLRSKEGVNWEVYHEVDGNSAQNVRWEE